MTAVDQAQQDLYELIAANATFADALVLPGIPLELPTKPERIYVSEDVVGWSRSRAGSDYIEESFAIVLVAEVWRSGDRPGLAKARVCEFVVAIDELLEDVDFYGYGSEDGELEANVTAAGYDGGRLAIARVNIPITVLI